jgi:hypothetical protein
LVSALKIEIGTRKEFQGFLQKPVDEDIFLKEVAQILKYEKVSLKEEKGDELYEFAPPEKLTQEEVQIMEDLYKNLKTWRFTMEVTTIEREANLLKGKFNKEGPKFLVPLMEKIEVNANKFNIKLIQSLLDHAIEKIQK